MASFVAWVLPCPCLGNANADCFLARDWNRAATGSREPLIWRLAIRDSQFADMRHISAYSPCAATQPPEALTTPSPILEVTDLGFKISVSFIIGTDGRVHSPLILESGGYGKDRNVLGAVRSWRYRPALCNGVPTEAEAKIAFSRR
jgi:TonB family protein